MSNMEQQRSIKLMLSQQDKELARLKQSVMLLKEEKIGLQDQNKSN